MQLGHDVETSSALFIPALYSAGVILPGCTSKLRLLVINLASVPGGQLVNSPTAQSLERCRLLSYDHENSLFDNFECDTFTVLFLSNTKFNG